MSKFGCWASDRTYCGLNIQVRGGPNPELDLSANQKYLPFVIAQILVHALLSFAIAYEHESLSQSARDEPETSVVCKWQMIIYMVMHLPFWVTLPNNKTPAAKFYVIVARGTPVWKHYKYDFGSFWVTATTSDADTTFKVLWLLLEAQGFRALMIEFWWSRGSGPFFYVAELSDWVRPDGWRMGSPPMNGRQWSALATLVFR